MEFILQFFKLRLKIELIKKYENSFCLAKIDIYFKAEKNKSFYFCLKNNNFFFTLKFIPKIRVNYGNI